MKKRITERMDPERNHVFDFWKWKIVREDRAVEAKREKPNFEVTDVKFLKLNTLGISNDKRCRMECILLWI